MNLLKKATDFITNRAANKFYQQLFEFQIFKGSVNEMQDDTTVYLNEGYGNIDVYSIIGRQNSMRKQSRLKLMKRNTDGTEEEVVKNHELLKFKKRVNNDMPTNEYIDLFHIFRSTCGEAFSYRIQQSSGSKTLEFYAMPADDVDIIEDGWMSPVRGYKLSETFGSLEFEPQEVIQSRMANPYFSSGTLHGLSPIRAARLTLDKQNEALSTQAKQFQNQGPSQLLYRDVSQNNIGANHSTEKQMKDLAKTMKSHTARKGNKLPMVVPDKYGVIRMGDSITDLDIIESTKDGLIKFCNMLNMPPELFGLEATYSNQAEARKAAWTDSIIPSNKALTDHYDAITINDVDEYSDLFWAYDYAAVEELQLGIKTKVEWMNSAYWTPNEIREATGKDKVDESILNEVPIKQGITFTSELSAFDENNNEKDFDYLDKPK